MRLSLPAAAAGLMLAALAASPARADLAQLGGALPDGRAYEQISPVEKNGNVIFGTPNYGGQDVSGAQPLLLAPDGSAATMTALGNLQGGAYGGATGLLATRTASGWTSAPHAPVPDTDAPVGIQGQIPRIYARSFSGRLSVFLRHHFSNPVNYAENHTTSQLIALDDAGREQNVAVGSLGAVVDYSLQFDALSADGAHTVFRTDGPIEPQARALDPGATEVYERYAGRTYVVGLLPDGSVPPAGAQFGSGLHRTVSSSADDGTKASEQERHAMSDDASQILFTAAADASVTPGLYARIDRARTVTVAAPPQGALFQDASGDGRHIVFLSAGRLTAGDTDDATDLYRFDENAARTGGTLTLLSRGLGSANASGIELVAIGDDARSGYFVSDAAKAGTRAVVGARNLYRYDAGRTSFVATLAADDQVSVDGIDPSFPQATYPSPQSRLTPDGRTLVFASHARLTGFDNAGHSEVYMTSVGSPAVRCLSCAIVGGKASADAQLDDPRLVPAIAPPRNVTSDGQYVVFESGDPLVPGDTDQTTDVYEWHAGTLALISAGTGPADSRLIGLSDGTPARDVMFTSADELVGTDSDTQVDMYDARIGGGFPEPAAPPHECATDCQGPPSASPPTPAPGSAAPGGAGNPPAATDDLAVAPVSASARAAFAHGRALRLAVRSDKAGTLAATARARIGARWVRVARATRTLRRSGTAHLTLRLARSARALLRHRTLSVRIDVARGSTARRLSLTLRRNARV